MMSDEKPRKKELPKYGGIRDLSAAAQGSYFHKEKRKKTINYREMELRSFETEFKIIVSKVLAQIRKDKGYRTDQFAIKMNISSNLLAVREHLGLNTMDRFIDHCDALEADPVKVFSDCLHLYKKNQKLRKEIHHAKEKASH